MVPSRHKNNTILPTGTSPSCKQKRKFLCLLALLKVGAKKSYLYFCREIVFFEIFAYSKWIAKGFFFEFLKRKLISNIILKISPMFTISPILCPLLKPFTRRANDNHTATYTQQDYSDSCSVRPRSTFYYRGFEPMISVFFYSKVPRLEHRTITKLNRVNLSRDSSPAPTPC